MARNYLEDLENEAFDQFDAESDEFDAEDGFDDEDMFDKNKRKTITKKSSITVVMRNPTAQRMPVELFNYSNSITKFLNKEFVQATAVNYGMHPLGTVEGNIALLNTLGLTAAAAPNKAGLPGGAGNVSGYVGFNEAGDLLIAGGFGDPVVSISANGKNVDYRRLFESTADRNHKLVITGMRITYTAAAQIDEEFDVVSRGPFGGVTENSISPRVHFNPNQNQGLIVDFATSLEVNADKGLQYNLQAGSTVTAIMFIERRSRGRK